VADRERGPWETADDLESLLALAPFRLQPFARWGTFVTNRYGLATPDYTVEKPAGTLRIVALGDSFTFDSALVPQDHMWHRRFGARLAAERGQPVEVVNLGVPAVGPGFARRMFDVEGARLAPDLVLLGLFLGNDLTDEWRGRGSVLRRLSFTWRLAGNAPRLWRIEARLERMRASPALGGRTVPGLDYDPDVPLQSADELAALTRESAVTFTDAAWPTVDAQIDAVVDTVGGLDAAVRAEAGRLVVVVIPDRVQVDAPVRDAALAGLRAGTRFDPGRVPAALVARLAAVGVLAVDLLPAFRDAGEPGRLWRRNDTHWSLAGNAVAADALWARLAGEVGPPR
jgi:hypothetical protein